MRFDFVSEDNKPYNKRDKATRHLIRQRATQAAAKTKKEARTKSGSGPSEEAQSKGPNGSTSSKVTPESVKRINATPTNSANTAAASHTNGVQVGRERTTSPDEDYLGEPWWPVLYGSPAPPLQPQQLPCLLPLPEVQAVIVGSLLSRYTLKEDHARISKMLGLTSTNFVSLIPEQYGRDPCLDAAIDCLGSRVQEFLSSSRPHRRSSASHYGRALQELQSALEKSDGQKQYDLCLAVVLLCLYELLDPEKQHSWLLHARGAAILLKHVGPDNITSELLKTLLMTLAPIMINETLFRAESCFLGEADWTTAIENCADSTVGEFHPRSELIVSAIQMTRRLPDLFNRVESVILRNQVDDLQPLVHDLEELNGEFDDFHTKRTHILSTRRLHEIDDEARIYHLATVHTCTALAARMLFAVSPSKHKSLESAALRSATLAHEIANYAATNAPTFHARMAFPAVVASSVIESSLQWYAYGSTTSQRDTVDPSILRDWCRSMGRLKDDAD